jgi:hypothetical protein
MTGKRGRPKKQRPNLGDPVRAGMSNRDIAAALGVSRKQLAFWCDLATIPDEEFEEALRIAHRNYREMMAELRRLARARAGKSIWYERHCPHCGGLLKIEAQS